MKRFGTILMVIGLLTMLLAIPVSASAEPVEEEAAMEETIELEEELTIDEEEVPLAGLPGVSRSDVAHVMIGVGICMIVVAGAILTIGSRLEHAK